MASRLSRTLIAVTGLIVLAALAVWVAARFNAPAREPALTVIDSGGTDAPFPGDLKGIPEAGTRVWVAVYQRTQDGVPTGYAREAPQLPGPFGPETRVSDPQQGPAYDPGVAPLSDGEVIVTWSAAASVYYAPRLAAYRHGP